MYEHALLAARAQLAAAGGEHGDAADQFHESGECWQRFGRRWSKPTPCSTKAAASPSSATRRPTSRFVGRALFDTMGARPRLNECDTLIAQASKLTS